MNADERRVTDYILVMQFKKAAISELISLFMK